MALLTRSVLFVLTPSSCQSHPVHRGGKQGSELENITQGSGVKRGEVRATWA